MVELIKNTEICLNIAKDILETHGNIVPVVIFIKKGLPILPVPLNFVDSYAKYDAKALIQEFIITFKPDCAIMITEAWMVTRAIENYEPGDIGNAPDKTEALVVDGAAIGQRYNVVQPFHWEGDSLVFGKRLEYTKDVTIDNQFFGTVWEILEAEGQTIN